MLPLWRNRVYVSISPERISMVMLGRGLKPKLLAQFDEAIQPFPSNRPVWQAALDKLAQVLAMHEWQHADADIVLSNRLARFAVIPPSPKLKTHAAQEAFARHVMSQTYGAVTSQWTLRIQHGKATEPWLVSAIDQTLLENLKLICANNKLKLGLVNPYLVPVFNRFSKQIKVDTSWLVITEPGASLFLLSKGGEISSVSSANHDSIKDLPVLLDRENLVSTLTEPCRNVYLHAPLMGNLSAMDSLGYQINKLEIVSQQGFPVNAYGHDAMALSGVM